MACKDNDDNNNMDLIPYDSNPFPSRLASWLEYFAATTARVILLSQVVAHTQECVALACDLLFPIFYEYAPVYCLL